MERFEGSLHNGQRRGISRPRPIGGLWAEGTRWGSRLSGAVIAIGSWIYGVSYQIEQPLLLAAVFLLTMVPLYGLGMLFASLFLLWGREAFHLAQLLQEPIYFLGGVNFYVKGVEGKVPGSK